MKRKTNLFYNGNSVDSKFITFSNYTDSLTGEFLSTDTNLFPSTFVCAYIHNLDKDDFIKNYLVSRYENKLAYLRDHFSPNIEQNMYPFRYLVDTIYDYDPEADFVLADNITEQDFNGEFTDTICVIDTERYKKLSYWTDPGTPYMVEFTGDTEHLYGWTAYSTETSSYEYIGPAEYSSYQPVFDDGNQYNATGCHADMILEDGDAEVLEFNIVVPLYDVCNRIRHENTHIENEIYEKIESNYRDNVPLGIWFSGEHSVTLHRDDNYYPTWSLLIGSQFKPFPASSYLPDEITKTATGDAFLTFAQVLTNQNLIMEKLEDIETGGGSGCSKKYVDQQDEKTLEQSLKLSYTYTGSYIGSYIVPTIDELSEKIDEIESAGYATTEYVDAQDNNILKQSIELSYAYTASYVSEYIDEFEVFAAGTGKNSVIQNNLGNIAKGEGAFATGYLTQADGIMSHTEGRLTQANTAYSHAEGFISLVLDNSTAYATSDGFAAHAEGNLTQTCGRASHVEGDNTSANNIAEHAEGRYNKSHIVSAEWGDAGNTIHSVGIGKPSGQEMPTANNKNAFEIMQNGDIYVYGVADWDGKTIDSEKTLQNTISAKQEMLQSGVNIKTINGNSLLGSGNIEISGGSSQYASEIIFDTNQSYITADNVRDAIDNTINCVVDNEKVTSKALSDLHNDIQEMKERISYLESENVWLRSIIEQIIVNKTI